MIDIVNSLKSKLDNFIVQFENLLEGYKYKLNSIGT
jgi:hypothetical protein